MLLNEHDERSVERAVRALEDRGDGFSISSSHGAVRLPAEAAEPSDALRLADQRMYANKRSSRPSDSSQTRDVLMTLLDARDTRLHHHLDSVSALAHRVGTRLGMQGEELEVVVRAAELHDVGKIAIPEQVLEKPGPLDVAEWKLLRQHTIIGERILASAPALRPIATVVRASHERWDGAGYPDGLAGEDIPLAARIVAVCDAFDAMVTDRVYRRAHTLEDALEELRRCAGEQFDPSVVEAFCSVLVERELEAAEAAAARSLARQRVAREEGEPGEQRQQGEAHRDDHHHVEHRALARVRPLAAHAAHPGRPEARVGRAASDLGVLAIQAREALRHDHHRGRDPRQHEEDRPERGVGAALQLGAQPQPAERDDDPQGDAADGHQRDQQDGRELPGGRHLAPSVPCAGGVAAGTVG